MVLSWLVRVSMPFLGGVPRVEPAQKKTAESPTCNHGPANFSSAKVPEDNLVQGNEIEQVHVVHVQTALL